MANPFLGQIMLVPYNFAPAQWAFCNGQSLEIEKYSALFSLLGITYGGDGKRTFKLPDLRRRVPLGAGLSPSFRGYPLGNSGGYEQIKLSEQQMPNHSHLATFTSKEIEPIIANAIIRAKSGKGDATNADDNYLATGKATKGNSVYSVNDGYSTTSDTTMNSQAVEINITGGESKGDVTVGSAGSNDPITVMQPYLAMHYIIALDGIYPSRN